MKTLSREPVSHDHSILKDRRNLLSLLTLIVAATGLLCGGFVIYVVHPTAVFHRSLKQEDQANATWEGVRGRQFVTAFSGCVVLIMAGATIVVRATAPFIRRLQESESLARHRLAQLQHAKERLEAKAADLQRMNEELDDFSYLASHDLKEPLRGISAYCEMLQEDYAPRLDDEARHRLATMARLCHRLERLIDDLLTYCRLGRQEATDDDLDMRRLAEDAIDQLIPMIEKCNGRVLIEGDLPPARGNGTLLGEVFSNLICNGLKFNDSAAPEVCIGSTTDDAPTYYVRDNGIGIEARHQEEIFSMFRRLHSRKKYEGTGAGLSFVRKIVESHQGRVWVQSEPGNGTTFFFSLLPLQAPRNATLTTQRHAHSALNPSN